MQIKNLGGLKYKTFGWLLGIKAPLTVLTFALPHILTIMGTINKKQEEEATPQQQQFKLLGYSNFIRVNPKSDNFPVKGIHHIEYWCGDATNVSRRFSWDLGMPIVAKSDLSTKNSVHASYLLRSAHLNFLFTSLYSYSLSSPASATIPTFTSSFFHSFVTSHGMGVRALALEVDDADAAFRISVSRGATPAAVPINLQGGNTVLSEVVLYGDVVLRYISG